MRLQTGDYSGNLLYLCTESLFLCSLWLSCSALKVHEGRCDNEISRQNFASTSSNKASKLSAMLGLCFNPLVCSLLVMFDS